ncbi:MAG TPA: helix-turn-helix transcriptional regulator [Draconibacterium sp.]|nr:helix-turn-helix transcriptional regulator [Draconibacterium sp.]
MIKRIIIQNHDVRRDYLKDVVKELVKQRQNLNLTQEELNARLGIADRLLGKWECGLRTPTSFNLYCWALSLGLKLTVIPMAANDNRADDRPARVQALRMTY